MFADICNERADRVAMMFPNSETVRVWAETVSGIFTAALASNTKTEKKLTIDD
jgi:hypothetical protein